MKNQEQMTHQEKQAALYENQAIEFDKKNAVKNRSYMLKAGFIKDTLQNKGLSTCKALEVGCGTGLLTQKLIEVLPNITVLATDRYQTMLDIARKRLKEYTNIVCSLYDVSAPPPVQLFEEQIDVVLGVDIIHHIETPVKAFTDWKKIVKKNGILLFLECNPANPIMYIRHCNKREEERMFLNNRKNLTKWASQAGWKNIHIENMPTYLPPGPKYMWNFLTKTEGLIHKIPLMKYMSGMFLIYAENS
jgi:ubiquinone/menaquinone biosynthesis C-methylase UbiE